jgi:hypothetical protein
MPVIGSVAKADSEPAPETASETADADRGLDDDWARRF